MNTKHAMFRNALLLTVANLAMRSVSMLFQAYLADCIGAVGIGLLQLIMTVFAFAVTLGTSGIRVAAMYLSAEEYGLRRFSGVRQAMLLCITWGMLLSAAAGALLAWFAPQAATHWIRDLRAVPSLRLLGITLPITCLNSVLTGYFTACGKIKRLVAVELGDRALTALLTVLLLRQGAPGDVSHSCLAIVGGNTLAAVCSVSLLLAMMLTDFRRCRKKDRDPSMGRRLARLCIPLALNDYLRSGLSTLEHTLIPHGLSRFGQQQEQALASYGTIHGMVFPVLMFPSTVLFALSDLLVPELARCRAEKRQRRIDHLLGSCLRLGGLYAASAAGLLFVLDEPLGRLIYGSTDAGTYLKLFAPLVVMLYLDCIVDGIHKGMGQQVYCVRVNTMTSLLDVLLLLFLLSRYGIGGYFISFLVSHAVNFYFSIRKLLQLMTSAPPLGSFLLYLACVAAATAVSAVVLPTGAQWHTVLACAGVYTALLGLLLLLTGAWKYEDHCRLRQVLQIRS